MCASIRGARPSAAFTAADETGMYLHVEAGMWTAVGNGKPLDAWLYAESERIIRAYGHHPSFCMLAAGNEPAGDHQERYLGDLVHHLKSHFPGRLYTGSSGWSALPENEYHVYYGPRLQMWGAGLKSIINGQPPQTSADYRTDIARFTVPIISHEVGQWCVYPDLSEIGKYTGVLRAGNLEIVRATLEDHHLGHLAHDFSWLRDGCRPCATRPTSRRCFARLRWVGSISWTCTTFPGRARR